MRFARAVRGRVRSWYSTYPKRIRRGQLLGRLVETGLHYPVHGTYENHAPSKLFFHFDTWRENLQPELAAGDVYTERAIPATCSCASWQ